MKITNLLEENIQENFCDLGLVKGSLDWMPKTQSIREQRDNSDFIRIKNFCCPKDITERMKTQVTDRKKIFAAHTSDKGLLVGTDQDSLGHLRGSVS